MLTNQASKVPGRWLVFIPLVSPLSICFCLYKTHRHSWFLFRMQDSNLLLKTTFAYYCVCQLLQITSSKLVISASSSVALMVVCTVAQVCFPILKPHSSMWTVLSYLLLSFHRLQNALAEPYQVFTIHWRQNIH